MITTPDAIETLWDYDYPLATERRFRAALAALPPASPLAVELMTQIARALGLQGAFAAAHALLDQIAGLLTPEMPRETVRYLLERGRLYFLARAQLDHACALFEQALAQAQACGADFYAIDAIHMLALVAPLDAQIGWGRQGLALAAQTADPRARTWRGTLSMNMGETFYRQGRYDAALACLRAAEDAFAAYSDVSIVTTRLLQWRIRRALKVLQSESPPA